MLTYIQLTWFLHPLTATLCVILAIGAGAFLRQMTNPNQPGDYRGLCSVGFALMLVAGIGVLTHVTVVTERQEKVITAATRHQIVQVQWVDDDVLCLNPDRKIDLQLTPTTTNTTLVFGMSVTNIDKGEHVLLNLAQATKAQQWLDKHSFENVAGTHPQGLLMYAQKILQVNP